MAKQVRPRRSKPVVVSAPRVRSSDEDCVSRFHQGPRYQPHTKSGSMAAIYTCSPSSTDRLTTGGVHLCRRVGCTRRDRPTAEPTPRQREHSEPGPTARAPCGDLRVHWLGTALFAARGAPLRFAARVL